MDQEIFDWLLLLVRWLHITTAMAWIGASFFFMWLDRSFEVDPKSQTKGHVGHLWMIHGGGFYRVEKMLMGHVKVPGHLHWFKWESYWTWFSGFTLLLMIFYTGNGFSLLDSSVSSLSYWQAVGLGLSCIVLSWFIYDFLWESKLAKNAPLVAHGGTILLVGIAAYFLCHMLSGRAAYIHIGGMLGTWMSGNVFLRIIPRQVKMVAACEQGLEVNQEWGKNAKHRSTHNTYFTLPVIFIMLSNHFPSTYGNKYNWMILLAICLAGAAIRHYFVIRVKDPSKSKNFAIFGLAVIAAIIFSTRENKASSDQILEEAFNESSEPPATAFNQQNKGLTLNGFVRFEGVLPKKEKLIPYPGCNVFHKGADIFINNVLVQDGLLENVLVRITKGLEGRSFPEVPKEKVYIDQRDCQYEPRVAAVRVGQPAEFINSDAIFHNVKSVSKYNEEFNVGMPYKDERMVKVFSKPEISLQVRCSVHPWMVAFIAVMDHPYFAVTKSNGEFSISNLEPGSYTLELWHEVFGTQTKDFTIDKDMRLDFIY